MLLIHSTQMSHRESLQWQNHPSIHFVNHLPNARGLKPLRERSGKFWVRGQSIIVNKCTGTQKHTHSQSRQLQNKEWTCSEKTDGGSRRTWNIDTKTATVNKQLWTSVRRPPKHYSLQSAWQCKVKNNKTSPSAVQNNDYVALNSAVKHKKHFKV